jgi:isopentenyl diphosphate isomerase/L-lactate dehydrogenase-like FMN-dependent dehydrogenase
VKNFTKSSCRVYDFPRTARCVGSKERQHTLELKHGRKLRASEIARRRTEEEGAEAFFLCVRRRRRRILDVRAADLQEEMTEQRFSVPSSPTKTAATRRTAQRAERAIKHSAMRERPYQGRG